MQSHRLGIRILVPAEIKPRLVRSDRYMHFFLFKSQDSEFHPSHPAGPCSWKKRLGMGEMANA
jgi:hypothetical protein